MKKVIEVKDLSQLEPASKGYVEIQREDKILRLPVRGLTFKEQEEIEEKYQIPEPPKQWKKVAGSDSPILVEATDDPKYKKELKKIQFESGKEVILAGLDIEIPGKTPKEKWDNLVATGIAVGDINVITQRIMELSNLTNKEIETAKDFFG